MFVNFSEEVRHILKQAEKQKNDLNHPYVGTEHLFLSILKDSRLINLLKKHKITYDIFKEKLISIVGVGSKKSEFNLYTPLLKRVLENAVIEAREKNNKSVSTEILIISMLDEEDGVAYSILKSLKVNIEKLYFDLRNNKTIKKDKHKKSLLDEIGTNLTKLAKEKKLDPVIGRDEEIKRTVEILLRRKKNNPILIGPAGVGKTAIVEGIANLISNGRAPLFLKNKKIISLNIFSLVSGTKYRGEFEEKMKNIIKELEENEDIILFIDEIHTLVGAGGAEGAIDASNILKPALARGLIKVIGATTIEEYKKFIEPDQALARRFQNVMIEEPNINNVIKILTEIKPLYEKYHKIKVPNYLIKEIAYLTDKYLVNRFEPDRSIDVLDEVCAKSSMIESYNEKKIKKINKELNEIRKEKIKALSKDNFKLAYDLKQKENNLIKLINNVKINKKMVTKKDILNVIKSKGNISISEMDNSKRLFYDKLKNDLNKTILGQEKNIDKLIYSLRKKDISKTKNCYSLLITGASGSGKTLFAKTFLKYFVKEKNILNIDLNEYKNDHTISKLVGTTAGYLGYDNKNNVFEKIRTNPNSALIIDNFDEASSEVQSLFIKILDTGKIEDAAGKTVDFTNTMIIFTGNNNESMSPMGFESDIKEYVKEENNRLKNKVSLSIVMQKLNDTSLKSIIKNKLDDVINKYNNIKIEYDKDYEKKLLEKIKKQKNLSSLNKIIENEFENKIIDAIFDNKNKIVIKKESVIY